jgi:membrane-bound ClpP family serine protease
VNFSGMEEELVYERKSRHPFLGMAILLVLMGAGLALLAWNASMPLFVLGIAIAVVGMCMDRVQWICGACGNGIEKTSTLCPHCRASLASMEEVSRMRIAEKRAERRAAKEELARRRAIQKSRGPKRGGR